MNREIQVQAYPKAHQGRWEQQYCGQISFLWGESTESARAWPVPREYVKEALHFFGYRWDVEKNDPERKWYQVYLNELTEVSNGVWYFEILQNWLD